MGFSKASPVTKEKPYFFVKLFTATRNKKIIAPNLKKLVHNLASNNLGVKIS